MDAEGNLEYMMYYFGEIRYSAELDTVNNQISRIGLGHNNERISKAIYGNKIKVSEESGDFDTLVIEKDGIPFWFSCPNMGIFHIKEDEHEDLDLKIASFANSIENAEVIDLACTTKMVGMKHPKSIEKYYVSFKKDDEEKDGKGCGN